MSLKQCPHCLTKTFIDENSEKWPCCGNLTNNDPEENIEDIIDFKKKEEIKITIAHTMKTSIYEVFGGILISLSVSMFIVFIGIRLNIYWMGLFILGLALTFKGIVDFKDMLKMEKAYKRKYGKKF